MKLAMLLVVVSLGMLVTARPSAAQPQPPGPPPPCVDAPGVQFVCGQQGPEDLVVVPGGAWVVAGVFGGPGGINLVRVSDRASTKADPPAPAQDAFDRKAHPALPRPPDGPTFTTHR